MTRQYLLYGHGGSYNHGGEALVRATISLLRQISPGCRIILSTHFPEQDKEFGIDADLFVSRNRSGKTNEEIYASTLKQIVPHCVCIHLGGDNYCYNNWQRYAVVHKRALEVGAISILWSCSIDPEVLEEEMIAVLRTHHLITARECVTYRALTEHGLTNVVQVSDIAFTLKPEAMAFHLDNFVALNASPLIIKKNPLIKAAIQSLMDYVLRETDMNLALVPHVLAAVDNDTEVLSQMRIEDEKRVTLISGQLSAGQYKYVISKARFGVFARTHGAIAAYSSLVPTLALGYSCKSYGIASDLGLSEYVLDAARISEDQDIVRGFQRLLLNEKEIKKALSKRIPSYIQSAVSQEALKLLAQDGIDHG